MRKIWNLAAVRVSVPILSDSSPSNWSSYSNKDDTAGHKNIGHLSASKEESLEDGNYLGMKIQVQYVTN